jgi:hypothetical protein
MRLNPYSDLFLKGTNRVCAGVSVACGLKNGHSGDAYQPKRSKPTAFEATPLYIEGTL